MLDEHLHRRALEAIQLLAERLCDPEKVAALVEGTRLHGSSPFLWEASSLVSGFGSLLLSYLYMAQSFPEQGWEQIARRYARLAAESTHQQSNQQLGLLGGISGLALSINLLRQFDNRYNKTSSLLETRIAKLVLEYPWRRTTAGVADYDYDIISGASGILGYLLSVHSQEPVTQEAIQTLVAYLTWLGTKEDEQGRKRWFIPPSHFQAKYLHEIYPTGYFNVGLAHGIPGPLAALSLAWLAGYQSEEQQAAIRGISDWLIEQQIQDSWGSLWPNGVTLQPSFFTRQHGAWFERAAWCYGVPGVARSLWLAGIALNNEELRQLAVTSLESALKRPNGIGDLTSPILCHGLAGLLIICLRFANETESPLIHDTIPILVERILGFCSTEYAFGVQGEDSGTPVAAVDNPGFLTGAAGVLLSLLAVATPIEPLWDRALLIA